MSHVQDVLDRYKGLCAKRDVHLNQWQELAELHLPGRAYFLTGAVEGQEAEQQTEVYDSTPMLSDSGLARAIDGLMKPSTSQWSWMSARDEELNEDDECKRYFDAVDTAMRKSIYNSPALFVPQSNCVDRDIATFGLGYLWTGERRDRSGLLFKSLFIGDVAIDENADGQIDTAYVCRMFTARQAVQIWGEDKLGDKVREALNSTNKADKDKKFTFVECITPRYDYDSRKKDNKSLPFSQEIVCVEDEHIVEESGYHEFPIACPRWELVPGQIYPRSPAMMALADARTLQAMGKTLLVAGQYAADPARWTVDDALNVLQSFPGGINIVSIEAVMNTNGRPIGTLEMGGDLPITLEMQQAYREMVKQAFLLHLLSLPTEGPDMTATEIMARLDEYIRSMGPIAGQLQSDYPGAIVPRVWGIMRRASYTDDGKRIPGAPLPEIPDKLKGVLPDFQYLSPIQKAQKRREQTALGQALASMEGLLAAKPEMIDMIDGDAIMRDLPDGFGFAEKYIRSQEQVDAIRQQRMQEMQIAKLLEAGQGAADIVKTGADAGKSMAQAEASA